MTYFQELAMLEDHWISINNLVHCSFILGPQEMGEVVELSGLSYSVTVTLGVGQYIKVYCVSKIF